MAGCGYRPGDKVPLTQLEVWALGPMVAPEQVTNMGRREERPSCCVIGLPLDEAQV